MVIGSLGLAMAKSADRQSEFVFQVSHWTISGSIGFVSIKWDCHQSQWNLNNDIEYSKVKPFDNQNELLTVKVAFWWLKVSLHNRIQCPKINVEIQQSNSMSSNQMHDWKQTNPCSGGPVCISKVRQACQQSNRSFNSNMFVQDVLVTHQLNFGESKQLCTSQSGLSDVQSACEWSA